MLHEPDPSLTNHPTAWWRESSLMLVLLLSIPTLCFRLTAVPLFGEEPRRALIAREMLETGDWLVPRTQHVYLPSRPPLQNWWIAVDGYCFGSFNAWAVRLPSVISTLIVAIIIYGYLRQRFGSVGSMAGAVSFLTMQLVMEFGRSAETEAVFTVFVAASLLLWHWGWIRKWPAWQMWSVGYACVALGMLTKGLQAPVYFAGSTGLYLLVTGNWRALFTTGHLAGLLTFAILFGAWQGPFLWQQGIADSWMIYFGDVAARFVDRSWIRFLTHLVVYPGELLLVRLMPWSILLLAFGNRHVRQGLGVGRDSVLFLTISILFSFVFVWLPPGSKVRYYMPLFPCFATLVGIAIDRIASLPATDRPILWKNFARFMTFTMAGTAIVVLGAAVAMPSSLISLPITGALGFAALSLGLAYVTQQAWRQTSTESIVRGVYGIAAFMALVQVGLVTTVQQRRCEDIEGSVKEIKRRLPAGAQLVSMGQVHHAFAFFYEQPIPVVTPSSDLPNDIEYFCLHTYDCEPPELPFAWEKITVVSCDRFKEFAVPKDRVFIGRRLIEGPPHFAANAGQDQGSPR